MSSSRNLTAAVQVVRALPIRTLLLSLSVAAGAALAMATLAIERGVTIRSEDAASSFGTDLVTVRSGARVIAGISGTAGTVTEEDVTALRAGLRGAKAVIGVRREDKTPVSVGSKNGVYKVFGVTPPWAAVRQFGADTGQFVDQNDIDTSARVCLIGKTVKRELFGDQEPIGQEINLNQVPFKVKGVLVTKGASLAEGDRDARIIIPITTFYDRLYKRVNIDQIVVQAANPTPESLEDLATQMTAILRKQHHLTSDQADDFLVRTPQVIAETSRTMSRTIFWMMIGLAVICGLVSAMIIVLVAGQAIRMRRGEIGIRLAMGATTTDILQQIWIESLIISLLGGLIGIAIGLAGGWALAAWRQLDFAFDLRDLIGPLVLVALASLAGLLPARAAAKLDPAQALRPS